MNVKVILAALTLISTGAHAADIVLGDEPQLRDVGSRWHISVLDAGRRYKVQ